MSKTNKRNCLACGNDCKGKKVGAKYFSKVICITCYYSGYAGFDKDGKLVIHPENDYRKENSKMVNGVAI